MARLDPNVLAHVEWLGFVQPVGLVVSPTALVRAGAILDRNDMEGQRRVRDCVPGWDGDLDAPRLFEGFERLARHVLGWSFVPKGYAGTPEAPVPPELSVYLEDFEETLAPDFAVRELSPEDGRPPWQLLVTVHDPKQGFDDPVPGSRLDASPHSRMERMLRKHGVLAGLLFNGHALRLVSAPRAETSGWLDFRAAELVQTAGRPICAALRLLLSEPRLLSLPRDKRLTALLEDSRSYQNEVSERLAEQVLQALYELLRGLQAAHDATKGELLAETLREHPDEVYRGLLTVILRLVFLLFAEERDMLPKDEAFLRHYSLAGLYRRLRSDASRFPDTMDQRFGAWAQLLVLFRMIHDGAEAGAMRLPARHGVLFDPDRFPFLEGRLAGVARQIHAGVDVPLVPDGMIYRALEKLLVLDGERLSYRALDVEQIGSVYETMMGFRMETATGRAVAVKAQKKHGAPTALDLDALLTVPAAKREKWILDRADRKLTDRVKQAVKAASTLDELHAALQRVIDPAATPDLVPRGAMVLQPSEARRRSGSHYTPRSLTEPIVRRTLEPILRRLRGDDDRPPRPMQILDLKVCDPAMGSGAFLVEACRQLGEALVESWHFHRQTPPIPADEDERVHAMRLVAQRCLYGIDRNPVAVDLAKVSLWLATLAKDHALTFVDHALRHGDSLVGVSRRQIEIFHWDESQGFDNPLAKRIREHLEKAAALRREIREAGEGVFDLVLRDIWDEAQAELVTVRLFGDLLVDAFFAGDKPKAREDRRREYGRAIAEGTARSHSGRVRELRTADPPLAPFHWEVEFPEVFDRENSGFDAFVGNPPFLGGTRISGTLGKPTLDWLLHVHPGSHGNGDLVAHFFRRAFDLLRQGGGLGLIATNKIAQGDTRSTGLEWICLNAGVIYEASKRVKWPGQAAVIVSIVHIKKGGWGGACVLDGTDAPVITAFLFRRGGHVSPERLSVNRGVSFMGSKIYGNGFTFDDTDTTGVASSIAHMRRLVASGPKNRDVIFPYIGGAEINDSPTQSHHRYVINFGERDENECRRSWPELMAIVEERVRPVRARLTKNAIGRKRAEYWWQYGSSAKQLYNATSGLSRVLVVSASASAHYALAFSSTARVHSQKLNVFAVDRHSSFAALQCRIHEEWSRAMGTTRGVADDLTYNSGRVFETFPFPGNWQDHPDLEAIGQAYYEFRASLMVETRLGLTKTYNRFHYPDEDDSKIARLRELHAAMDRAVLDAYGWTDISTDCEFLLDYEDEDDDGTRKRKKPWRYRWPDDVRDEVLARLLELNAERAKEEARRGAVAGKKGKTGELFR